MKKWIAALFPFLFAGCQSEEEVVSLQEQIQALAEVGLILADGVAESDLMELEDGSTFKGMPYSELVESMGYEVEREPFTPKCARLWVCDFEQISGDGSYRAILERLEQMTGQQLGVNEIRDRVDFDQEVAWVEFEFQGQAIHWDFAFSSDWLDPSIFVHYDSLLKESGSQLRLYANAKDFGQTMFFAALTPTEILELIGLTGGEWAEFADS
jgi:hypothetical protein